MAFALGLVSLAGNASAQTSQYPVEAPTPVPTSDLSVLDRPVPGYEPIGLPWGSFYVFPRLDLSATYDSNVYATPNHDIGDVFFDIRPGVYVVSNWPRHAVSFEADADERVYASRSSDDQTNFHTALTGRLDITNDYITGGLGYTLGHEDRASPDNVFNQKNPIAYQEGTAWLRYVHEVGLVGFRITGQIYVWNYDNGTTLGPPEPASPFPNLPCFNGIVGNTVCETYRDRNEYWVTPQISYQFYPGYYAFIQTPINWRDYYEHNDIFGYNRSSWGWEVDAGLSVALTGITFGRVFVGYLDQMYDDRRLSDAQGVGFGGDLLWNVTPVTSVKLALSRTVQETEPTTVPGASVPASSILETAGSAAVEHAFRPNILGWARIGAADDKFVGTVRDDTIFYAQTGVRYLINRFVNVGLDFGYDQRSSNISFPGCCSYSREQVTARLRVQE